MLAAQAAAQAVKQTMAQISALRAKGQSADLTPAEFAQYDQLETQLDAEMRAQRLAEAALPQAPSRFQLTARPTFQPGLVRLPPAGPFIRDRSPGPHWQHLGVTRMSGQLTAPDGSTRSYFALRIPFAWLIVLPAFTLVLSLRSSFDRRRQIARGFCGCCGYDLRASKVRCPECGTPMPAAVDSRMAGG